MFEEQNQLNFQKQELGHVKDVSFDSTMLTAVSVPFIENEGQLDEEVIFYAKTFAGTVYVTEEGLIYSLTSVNLDDDSIHGVAIKEVFLDSKNLQPVGADKSDAIVNYFVGEKEKWRSNIPTYNLVNLGEVWPLVNVELKAYGNNFEKLFKVAPGGSVDSILLEFDGITGLAIAENGQLLLSTDLGTVSMTEPIAYQYIDGVYKSVQVSYLTSGKTFSFAVGNYDPNYTLVIDPLLASTFLGGSDFDSVSAIEIDNSNNVFVAGRTLSTNYPTTTGAFDTTFDGFTDVFVTKLKNDLSGPLLGSTFLGGSNQDQPNGMTLDGSGNVYVVGTTRSTDYPTTTGAFDTVRAGLNDGFITKLKSDLTGPLLASTYLGGSGATFPSGDGVNAITLDGSGNVYVTGATDSTNHPTTMGAFDTTHNGGFDVYVTKLKSDLTGPLLASTFIGKTGFDVGRAIALDGSNNVIVAGSTTSTFDFPLTTGAFDTTHNGGSDVFVTKLKSDLTGPLLASTLVGGVNDEFVAVEGIVIDGSDNVYVTGRTDSTNYPTTTGAFDTTHNGDFDVYVTKLKSDLTGPLLASTFVGGSNYDEGSGIALDTLDNVFITGPTFSTNYPTTTIAFDTTFNGGTDAFVTKLKSDLTGPLLASTFIGPASVSEDIDIDGSYNVFITGFTFSTNYPTTSGAFDQSLDGTDVFVSKFSNGLSGTPYADVVIRYDPLFGGAAAPPPLAQYIDPTQSLGLPDFDGSNRNSLTLGSGGLLEVGFVDNVLTNNGDSSSDLRIYEIGADVELTYVSIRPTAATAALLGAAFDTGVPGFPSTIGDGFYEIGFALGSTVSIDIDSFFPAAGAGTYTFDAVQFIDDPTMTPTTAPSTIGADIDAVSALGD